MAAGLRNAGMGGAARDGRANRTARRGNGQSDA